MSNIYPFDPERKDGEKHMVEASEWIAKMDQGLSDADAEALSVWMRADPRNEAELLTLARMWDKMDALSRLSEVFPHASETVAPPLHKQGRRLAMAASFAIVITRVCAGGRDHESTQRCTTTQVGVRHGGI